MRRALETMRSSASPGCLGLDVGTLRRVCANDHLAETICSLLNHWVFDNPESAELHLTLLSAIPKTGKPTSEPKNLRPISVASIWYRWIAKIFAMRLDPHLPNIYSPNQHGFCPRKNVNTALLTLATGIEFAQAKKRNVYIL